MSSVSDNAGPFSVFISYASADRVAARALSQSLASAGLDVWLDEEELAGGEAWDAKIRRQIRTCTYFMPVISATTEARREGYFRREWRLAVERTLDLADDVTFLVPIVIDDTPEQTARVPEKFTAVQWLRCPEGRETPALVALAHRLAAPHAAVPPPVAPRSTPPPLRTESRATARAASRGTSGSLRPFPTFPAFPAPGHRLRFLYDFVVWLGLTIAAFWVRLPRWLRVIAMVVIVFKAINGIFNLTSGGDDAEARKAKAAASATAPDQETAKPTRDDDTENDVTVQKIMQATGAAIDALQGGRPLAMVPFGSTDASIHKPTLQVFAALRAVVVAGHDKQVSISVPPLPPTFTDTDAFIRGAGLKCRWLLTGTAQPETADAFKLEVKLYDNTSRTVIWQTSRTVPIADAAKVGEALAAEVREHISFDAPPKP